jgi:DMATS type aromatic prenyltransferase
MTDDFTPIEFSWNWGLLSDTVAPTVRFSIEAIGRDAGLPSDAWNWCETASFVERLAQEAPTVDLSLFYELGLRLLDECNQVDLGDYAQAERASRASTFLAFDLKGDVRIPKVYFVPFNHLATEERDQGAIIHDLLMPLAIREKWESLVVLLKFGLSSAVNGVVPFMIANDCVPLQKNRIKIYFRSADTTFRTVVDILGAFDAELWQGQALRELQELWRLLFKQDPGLDQRLPTTSHETAGILYYFEVRPGSLRIVPKVYLPVKHYGINDQHTAMALATFFRNHGPPRDQWIKEYLKTIGQICSHRRLEERSGLHTYISCSLKNGSLDITSYINPEIYSVYAEK